MNQVTRRSGAARTAALGLIIITLSGNIWLTMTLVNMPIPTWIYDVCQVGLLLVGIGAVGIFLRQRNPIPDET